MTVESRHNANSTYTGSQLQVGRRVPHCWLLPATTSAICDYDDTDAATAANAMQHIVSTVQLPALMDKLIQQRQQQVSADECDGSASSGVQMATPTVLVLVHSNHATATAEAIERIGALYSSGSFAVVSIEEYGKKRQDFSHAALQSRFQQPRYSTTSNITTTMGNSTGCAEEQENRAPSIGFGARFETLLKRQPAMEVEWFHHKRITAADGITAVVSAAAAVPTLRLTDLSGRWQGMCNRYNNNNDMHNRNGTSSLAVVVRPDGHVAHVISLNEARKDVAQLLTKSLIEVAKALYLVEKS